MSFNILYVEDREKDWTRLEEAINQWKGEGEQLIIARATDPEDLERKLNLKFDLVLADIYFPDDSFPDGKPRLGDIIDCVKRWSKNQPTGRALPIIAYTVRGDDITEACLHYKDDLYDIWDKSSASPYYAAWRFSLLSKEIQRLRPDALIQRRIREMQNGAKWHQHIVEMTRQYDAGLTELDQIERVNGPIGSIALELGERERCNVLWKIMIDWEGLSKAVSRKTRGHARHVINVFWLGYYLLHHECLRPIFLSAWKNLLDKRSHSGEARGEDPIHAMSNAWFYAGLFHDVGGCVEKAFQTHQFASDLLAPFGDIAPKAGFTAVKEEHFMKKAEDWLGQFERPLRDQIEQVVRKSLASKKPDQGAVAAVYLREALTAPGQAFYVKEGARAMSMHNLFPSLPIKPGERLVTWEDDPLVCLLLLCDQLQTWDRERGDETLKVDYPSRAELSVLEIIPGLDGRPEVNMTINYIAPAHLLHAPEIYDRVKRDFDETLRDYPYKALDKISKPWPFSLRANCTLSDEPLATVFDFRSR